MICPKCQVENPENNKFCRKCGEKIPSLCPKCGTPILPDDAFCGDCGHPLSVSANAPQVPHPLDPIAKLKRYLPTGLAEKILAQRDRIEGEKRQVTVLFCDLVGYTPLTERLGPEEAYVLMDRVFEILIHKIHDFEGSVNEMTGDGVMGLFGAPIALEDAPQRAIRSAVAIHREMARFNEQLQQEGKDIPPLRMRIGINTGPVVVGTLGNDLRVDFTVVGDTVNLASRMEGLAEPGTTYVTAGTFKLTEGFFHFEGLGKKEIKGKAESIEVYRVIALSSMRTRFDVSAERGLTPLMGRQQELEFMLNSYHRAIEGNGQAVVISSEAGMGKSRLLYEFHKAIANDDVFFYEGKCLSYSRSTAYHPIIDVLKAYFRIDDGEPDSAVREKVMKGLDALSIDAARTLPCLLELLSVKDSGIDQEMMGPEAKRERINDTLSRMVINAARLRPMVLAIEDLHWIDASSEEAVGYLLEHIPAEQVLLVFTCRPEFAPNWSVKSYCHHLSVSRLSDRESIAIASHLLQTDGIEDEIAALVIEKTEGVPFFVEEFLKSLKDLGIIEVQEGRCRLIEKTALHLPSSIQDIITARVDILPESAKLIIKTGSAIEREFSHELIQLATGCEATELAAGLSALKDAELIYQRGVGADTTYIFKHALTMEVVYASLLTGQKQELHRKVGRSIELLHKDTIEEHSVTLARHFTEGALYEEAAKYAKAAARRAQRAGAYTDAIAHAKTLVYSLEQLPVTPDKQKQIIDARTILANYFMILNRHLEAKEAVEPIVDLAVASDYRKRLPGIYVVLGSYYVAVEKMDKGYLYLNLAIDIAKKTGDWFNLWNGNFFLGVALSTECQFEKAIDCFNICLQLSEMGNNLNGIANAKGTMSAFALSFYGRSDTASVLSLAAFQAAEKCGDTHIRGMAYASHGSTCYFKGDFEQACRFLTEAIDLCCKSGHAFWRAWAEFWLANTYFSTQCYKEAIEFYTRATSTMNDMGQAQQLIPYAMLALQRAILVDGGTITPAFEPATYRRENKIKVNEGIIQSTIADILIKLDPGFIPEAETAVRAAIAADERNQTKWYLGQDYAVYSEVCRIKGDLPLARAHLVKAIEIFRECGADGWVEKYEKELTVLQ